MGQLGGVQKGLRRDAAAVEAGTADLLLLDDGDFEPELGSTDGADISGGATADDGYVERLIGHTSRLYPPLGGLPKPPASPAPPSIGGPWRSHWATVPRRIRPGHWARSPSCRA